MKTGDKGLALIKSFEGLKLTAYLCPARVWTIGYGHTGPDVKAGQTITESRAVELLRADLAKFETEVNGAVVVPTTQAQFDALVSFAYNLGGGALAKSTLMRLHNAGDFTGAAAQFARWNKASGRVLAGLTRRREAERKLYVGAA